MTEYPLLNIFLSYNRQNLTFVQTIARHLEENHFGQIKDIFFDQDVIGGGDNWADQIQQALCDSDVCIVFIGEQGIGKWQSKEVLNAVSRHINTNGEFKIIPVIIPHSNRENVQKNFPWLLSDTQWIEFTSENDPDAFLKLTEGLRSCRALPVPIPENSIPYKGLDFFEVDDAPFFFGRTSDVNWVFYKKLRLNSKSFGNRFLAVVGDSGSGKSSFARAGLLAAIKAGRFTGSNEWKQVIFSPEDNPLLKLASSLQSFGIIGNSKEMEDEAKNDNGALRRRLEVYGKKLVILVDHFEEVITQCRDHNLQTSFLGNLIEGLKSEYLVCILTLRSDFYAGFAAFPLFADLLENNNYTLTGLDFNEGNDEWERYLLNIIQKPAKLAGVKIEDVLARQMLEDIKGINGILPALELALIQLWNNRKHKTIISSEDYDNLSKGKGIGGVIEQHANDVLNLISIKSKNKTDIVKAVFIRLVEITHNKEDVRKTVKKEDLIGELSHQFKEREEIENILTELSGQGSRLIRIKKDSEGDDWVEVIHEVLIRQWSQLRKWLDNRREAIVYRNFLEQYIEQNGSLFAGKRLREAEVWELRNGDISSKKIADFIKRGRTRLKRKKAVSIGSILFFVCLGIAGWLIYPTYRCYNNDLARKNDIIRGWYDLTEIHSLTINNPDHLRWTGCFSNLETLDLINNLKETVYINQSDLDLLPQRLQNLTITDFKTDSVLNLSKLKHLRSLILSNTENYTLQGLPTDSLHYLGLDNTYLLRTLSGIEDFKGIDTLILFHLINLNSLKGIENLTGLKLLKICNTGNLTNLIDLDNLTALKSLTLSELSLISLKGIENLKELQSLELNSLYNLSSLQGLDSLTALKSLRLDYLNSLISLKGIDSLKELQSLELKSLEKLTSLKGIENMKQLDSLQLTSLTNLASLKEIESLEALKYLKVDWLKSLTSLRGIEYLKGLRSLEIYCYFKKELKLGYSKINLVQPRISDPRILDSLQKLTPLDLSPIRSMKNINNLKIVFQENL